LKEKKNVTDAAIAALDAMSTNGCLPLADMLDDITTALNAKNPQAKALTLQWLSRALKLTSKQSYALDMLRIFTRCRFAKAAKPFATLLVSCMEDSAGDVREAACTAFGAFAGLIGERAVLPYIEKFEQTNKVMFDKIKSFFPSVTGSATASATGSATGQPTTNTVPVAPPVTKPSAATRRPSVPVAETAKKPPAIKRPSSAANLSSEPKSNDPPAPSDEEMEAKAASLLSESVRTQLASKDWKERLAAVENVASTVESMSSEDRAANVDVLICFILDKTPGYGDVNAQVCAKTFSVAAQLARGVARFPKRCAAVVIPNAITKLAEPKNKQPASDVLTSFCERLGPQFVFAQLYKTAPTHKNPSVTAAALTWMAQTIQDFGTAGIKIADLISVMKTCLEATNPKIKTSAVDVLIETRKRKGPSM